MTYPPEHTTDFDNDEWINGLDRENEVVFRDKRIFRPFYDEAASDYSSWTPREKAAYWDMINQENGDYD